MGFIGTQPPVYNRPAPPVLGEPYGKSGQPATQKVIDAYNRLDGRRGDMVHIMGEKPQKPNPVIIDGSPVKGQIGGNTANPSAVYAKQQGYDYKIVSDSLGNQSGMVTKPGQAPQDAFAVYRQENNIKKAANADAILQNNQNRILKQQVPFNAPQQVSSGVWGQPKAQSVLKKNVNPYLTRRGV
jgi:putative hemolysin